MLMMSRAVAWVFLLLSPCVYAQSDSLERPAADFTPNSVGLTETILKFAHEEHLPEAIEYVDRASIDQPIAVSLQSKTVRQTLDTILRNGRGYSWRLRNGIIEITNRRASKHAERSLNKVIPDFEISEGESVQMTSTMLWWQLQIALDPSINGFGGDVTGRSTM